MQFSFNTVLVYRVYFIKIHENIFMYFNKINKID